MSIPVLPELLDKLLKEQYGPARTEEIKAGMACRRPVTLRINPLRASREDALEQLRQAGAALREVPWYADALVVENLREDELQALPIYEAGGIYLQNLSAMLPPLLMQPRPGETILDMAAAPGGKTTQIAALTGNQALITACEKNGVRAQRLQFNLQRQGATRVHVMQEDARRLDDLFSFDRILLDAPCSGSGTVLLAEGEPQRRMTPDWLKKTVDTQRALLQKALRLLKPGHEMVYATCSILRMENEDVVRRALSRGEAELLPVASALAEQLPQLPTTLPGALCVCPDEVHEGFFVARLRKKK